MKYRIKSYRHIVGFAAALLLPAAIAQPPLLAGELSLNEALQTAVEKSSRGSIIDGDLEVAEQNYHAEKINFYIPEISLNGSAPVYNVTESFRFFGGLDQKQLIKTTDRDFHANIQLKQALITGGNLSATSNLWNRESQYPLSGIDVIETSNQGVFDFTFQQPLLKPSDAKNALNNKRDDLEIARLGRAEALGALKKEVVEAYFGDLLAELQLEISRDKEESARLTTEVDSVKFVEEVISEEVWLESASKKLDAELDRIDKQNQQVEKERELALLLDYDVTDEITTRVPSIDRHLTEPERQAAMDRWEESVPIRKAWYDYRKAKRQADYTAGTHGLTGTFEAGYSLGRGTVDVDGVSTDNNTDSWSMALNFTFPIWDGGSAGAAIKAARLTAQKSELEYQRAMRSAKAEIANLINRIDISYRKLDVLQKQIEIAQNKLDIAKFRYEDGQISKVTYLENKVFYLEARIRYLEELKTYINNRIDLGSKYLS